MKQTKLFLSAMALLLCSITASAHDFEVGGIYYNITSAEDLTVAVTYRGDDYYDYSNEYSGAVTIPSTVTYNSKTYSVTSIGNRAFQYCSSLTAITFPESVTSIGEFAFADCSSITTITLPESVTSIGDYAFAYCRSLTAITIPEGVTSIGYQAFSVTAWYDNQPDGVIYAGNVLYRYKGDMPENTTIEVKEGTVSITEYAFQYCSSLITITLSEGVTSIGAYAFGGCLNLAAITIPEGVTSIGDHAFSGCSSLTAITIPENSQLTNIGSNAFAYCSSLTSIIIPEGVTSIGERTFYSCSSLITITLPEGVTSIGDEAFENCSSLTAITLPASVTSIGGDAFYGCSSLTAITLPEGVTSIGGRAFYGCSLKAVHITDIAAWCRINFSAENSNPLYYYGVNLYLNGVAVTGVTIPEEVTEVKKYAFYNCKSITSVIIPTGITKIDENAFYGCSNLSTVTLPSSLHVIRASAFERCSSLKSVTIPATVEFVYQKAFASCSNLESVKVLAVKPPFANENTFSNYNIELCVPEEAMSAYQETNPWSKFASIKNLEGEEVETKVCDTPTISYADGKVMLTCETEGAKVITTIAKGDDETREEMEFDYIPTQTFTAYAIKEGYQNSDIATLTLCWIPCTEDHETDDEDGIITIPSQPVLISTQGGTITLTGLADGTDVAVYTTAGTQLGTATAVSGTATITTSLTTGNTAIVKIGNSSIKVVVK